MDNLIARKIDSIKMIGGLRARDLALFLDTTPQTISRWTHGKVEPQQTHLDRLLELEWLVGQLREFYEPKEARLWLYTKHKLLNGDSPADRLQKGEINSVLALISQLKDSAFV
jgi:hypothetical protein